MDLAQEVEQRGKVSGAKLDRLHSEEHQGRIRATDEASSFIRVTRNLFITADREVMLSPTSAFLSASLAFSRSMHKTSFHETLRRGGTRIWQELIKFLC